MTVNARIAIPVPTSHDLPYNERSWRMYAEAVRAAEGFPVRVELNLSVAELRRIAREIDGVLLPGSPADVDPRWYGRERLPACAEADPARDASDRLLLEEAYVLGTPVLGICYGMQSLNVWRGGTLIQDLSPVPVNHAAGSKVALAHGVTVGRDSRLAELVDGDERMSSAEDLRLMVNSSHHQSVEQVGAGLRVVAVSSQDGVVEAVERADGSEGPEFLLGLQWHPERSFLASATSRAVFASFVAAAVNAGDGARVRGC